MTLPSTCVSTMLRPARVLRRAVALVVVAVLASLGAARRAGGQSLTPGGGTPFVHITTAVAGSAPTAVQVATTTLAYSTPNGSGGGMVLQAKLNSALPAGVTLQVSVSAPSGGTSLGLVTMTTSYANLTGAIPKNSSGTLTLTHRLTATTAAGVQALSSATLSFQLF